MPMRIIEQPKANNKLVLYEYNSNNNTHTNKKKLGDFLSFSVDEYT